jgi:hypothetical protein
MDTISLDRKTLLASAAIVAIAFADRAVAWLLGTEPLIPAFAGGGGSAGLLVWGFGHCDGVDGPVVTAARKALDSENANLMLPWVRKEDEAEVLHAFEHAVSVRKLGPQAKALADRHFFETLVRVHRAGEGAPYTGLKPAGRDLGPAIPAADRALDEGSVEKLTNLLTEAVRQGVSKHFNAAMSRRKFDVNDVSAGRAYVEAYVACVHYVERLWRDATGAAHGHHAEHGEHAAHEH